MKEHVIHNFYTIGSGGYWVRRARQSPWAPPFFTVVEGPPFLKMPCVVLFHDILHGFMNLRNSQKFGVFSK